MIGTIIIGVICFMLGGCFGVVVAALLHASGSEPPGPELGRK